MKSELQKISEAYGDQQKQEKFPLMGPTIKKSTSDVIAVTFDLSSERPEVGKETDAEKVSHLVKQFSLKLLNPANVRNGIVEVEGKRSKIKEFALKVFTKPEEVKKLYPYLF